MTFFFLDYIYFENRILTIKSETLTTESVTWKWNTGVHHRFSNLSNTTFKVI